MTVARLCRSASAAVLVLILAALLAPASVQALSFSGPTNFTVRSFPDSVAVGDFNSDGKLDLAVANQSSNNVSILLGNGDGSFAGQTNFPAQDPISVAVGDLNADAKLDLAVASTSNSALILLGNGDGSFTGPTTFPAHFSPSSVALGHFNGDGALDLVVANGGSNDVSILLGNGSGSFSSPTNFGAHSVPYSVVIGDFNGDGAQDLAVANASSSDVSILLGNGSGAFSGPTNFPAGTGPFSVAVGNFNGDTKLDLAVANTNSNDISILLGNGDGTFSAPTNVSADLGPRFVSVSDFNGDGRDDLAVANVSADNVSVLLGKVDGTFVGPTNFPARSGPRSVAVGDFNGDGRSDIAVTNQSSNDVSILLNTTSDQGYPRPKGATPTRVSLVPAFRRCLGPDLTHGAPLASPSCSQPIPISQYVTIGTPDSNGEAAKAIGFAQFKAVPGDVALQGTVTDVRDKSRLTDWLGELQAVVSLRLTDRRASSLLEVPQTTTDFDFAWALPCVGTSDSTVGSTCSATTTADSLIPGAVSQGDRSIWGFGQVQVRDGGEDGIASTASDNTLFMKQGVFVP